jgi:hypothetical protein
VFMPSTELTKAPGLLDEEIDQRDWFSDFREEKVFAQEPPRHEAGTLFTVVTHGRSLPIILPGAPPEVEIRPAVEHRRRSMLGRVKRAVSPTLTALFIAYVAIVFMTAWIGIRRSDAARSAEPAIQTSTPEPVVDFQGPASDRP